MEWRSRREIYYLNLIRQKIRRLKLKRRFDAARLDCEWLSRDGLDGQGVCYLAQKRSSNEKKIWRLAG